MGLFDRFRRRPAAPTVAECQFARNDVTPSIALTGDSKLEIPLNGDGEVRKVMLTVTESNRVGHPYGAQPMLKLSNPFVAVYGDAGCTQAIIAPGANQGNVANAAVVEGNSLSVWVKAIRPGDTTLTFELTDPNAAQIHVYHPVSVNLNVLLIIEPRIKLEHRGILLNRQLANHLHATDAPIVAPAPTRIDLSLERALPQPDFDGEVKLAVTAGGARIDLFNDANCAVPFDPTQPIQTLLPLSVYLRGKQKGSIEVTLTAGAALTAGFKPGDPFTAKMGVLELELQVQEHDLAAVGALSVNPDVNPASKYHKALKNLKLPDQVSMTAADRVGRGRLLHLQDSGHFGRARLLLPRLQDEEWLPELDACELLLEKSAASGDLKVFDKEFEGAESTLPLAVGIAELRKGGKELWVEGAGETTAARAARLELGLRRPDAPGDGLVDGVAHTAKKFGDVATFTVAKIETVEIDYAVPGAGGNAWDLANRTFFINMLPDTGGREITLKAHLSHPIADVQVHFMLVPHRDNRKVANWGIDLAGWSFRKRNTASWKKWPWHKIDPDVKRKDRTNRTDYLTVSGLTDALGDATATVTLSRFGGDQFYPAAYLAHDPHLAKYRDVDADLRVHPPVLGDIIKVLRRFWHQRIEVEGIVAPAFTAADGAVSQYERVKVEMLAAPAIAVTAAEVAAMNPPAHYPRYMVKLNGGNANALVIHDGNEAAFLGKVVADPTRPVSIPIIICDAQWDPGVTSTAVDFDFPAANPRALNVGDLVLTPALQGGDLLVAGTWGAAEWDPAANAGAGDWTNVRNGVLTAGDVDIDPARTSLKRVRVNAPATLAGITPTTHVWIRGLQVHLADGVYLGEYASAKKRILAVYDPTDNRDFQNTIVHEAGHGFFQVLHNEPVAGAPPHPQQKDKGQGNHCRHNTDECVMYDAKAANCINRYCEVCHPYLLVQDMAALS